MLSLTGLPLSVGRGQVSRTLGTLHYFIIHVYVNYFTTDMSYREVTYLLKEQEEQSPKPQKLERRQIRKVEVCFPMIRLFHIHKADKSHSWAPI